jgi:uncharacterized protein YegP (UPF0339 family)
MPRARIDKFVTFDTFTLRGRRWFFRYQGNNGEPVFQSEAYNSPEARDNGIEAARGCADAIVKKGAKR